MDAKLLQLVETIKDESTKHVVSTIISELKKTQNEVSMQFKKIEDFCSELEMRVREQERYTSKDSIIVDNPPFDPNVDDDALLELIVFFIKTFLRYELEPSKIKGCHILPGCVEEKGLMASVIVKFLYFPDKNQIYASRRYLKGQKNEINQKNIFVREDYLQWMLIPRNSEKARDS